MWQTHGQSTTHRSLRRTQFFYLFSRSLSFSLSVQLATFAYDGSCNFCCHSMRHIKTLWRYINLKLKSCRSSYRAREGESERERQSWGPGVIIDTVDVCFLSISKVRDRATLKQQIPPATCHPLGVAATAAVPLATRSLAVPHCNKSCDFSQLKLSRAFSHRFSACFDFPSLPFLICHLKQKLPNLSLL